ncbi:MAG: response regulator [Ktedonobacterales bacterium]|nr:response regulator [Ktedonobacterales bacterium]
MDSRQPYQRTQCSGEGSRPANAGADPPPRASPAPHVTILIAENEENNRHLMEQILKLAGYACILATNGLEALHALDLERVDLVLIDLSMPILDGYRATELIRQRPGCAALPVVAVTAHALSGDRERALSSGCTEYLVKPFRPRDLLRLVERLLCPC